MKNGRTEPRRVLHVLPHPGGGGETYIDLLSGMEGYAFERTFLAPAAGSPASVPANALAAQWAALGADLVHVHGEIAAAACLPALAMKPAVVTLHGLHFLRRSQGIAREGAAASLALIIRAASRTICVAASEAVDAVAAVGEWARARLMVIPNGVSLPPVLDANERRAARVALGLAEDVAVGAMVSALDEHKGALTAARAARQARDGGTPLVILLAGEGPMRAAIESEAGDAVRLLGQQRDVRRVLAAADFFVLPSQREGLSFALLEAMALGLAPIVSDAAGNVEAVGDTGVVVPYGDAASLAAALVRLARDAKERGLLGTRARERVETNFRADEMLRRTREVYETAIAA
jgi:glycosyltransferase involved in cell wall biosynthesis